MFSNALKSISSTPSPLAARSRPTPLRPRGPWKIYGAKKKATPKEYSLFVFDKKSLDSHASDLSRSAGAAFKGVVAEVIERLKKEASSLARLRHPNILELVEPVEGTRGGGLQFVTEPMAASLASLLQEKRSGGVGGRSSRYVTEDSDGNRRRREPEIDELKIQKGLLQISKALKFLYENAGLVHGNSTPDAVLINAKVATCDSNAAHLPSSRQHSDDSIHTILSQSNLIHLSPDIQSWVERLERWKTRAARAAADDLQECRRSLAGACMDWTSGPDA